jgi:guanosine-3',5'-bis(diphosphate) 3'-pyrophosphohydrolase
MKEPIIRFQDILEAVRGYMPDADTAPLRKAYVFAAVSHRGQLRKSGIPYLGHPLAVTKTLTDLRMDVPTLCGGLLHDVLEDCEVEEAVLKDQVGEEVTGLVVGLTKTSKVALQSTKRRRLESYRKTLIAMSRDIRILMIKLSDRLHNMRTLFSLSDEQRKRISEETLTIYAPLANRLGISWMRSELEDLSFQHLNPELYEEIRQGVEEKVEEKAEVIQRVCDILEERFREEDIPCEIAGRVKHYYSIHRKMIQQEIDLEQIFDLFALRAIVAEERHCYQVLGVIHSLWAPVPGRFKDYIAQPKANQYRSLHTTVFGPSGDCVEIQIRSRGMHREAEYGVASHWIYKERAGFDQGDESTFKWLRGVLNSLQEISSPKNFLDVMQLDLFPDQVYVLTPTGEARELPRGSTPVDFAYTIHSEVGDHCARAKVNGKLVPLKYELQNGDMVEILTSKTQTPRKDWMKFVKTADARAKIRAWVRKEEKEQAQSLGKEILEKGLRKSGLHYGKLLKVGEFKKVLKAHRLKSLEDLLRAVAYGRLSVGQVVEALPKKEHEQDEDAWDKGLERLVEKAEKRSDTGVKVRGISDIFVRFAKCCNPVHGEEIVGFITRGRGVTIHAKTCLKVREGSGERWIDVNWDEGARVLQRAKIRVVSEDRPGLLAGLSKAIAAVDVNISQAKAWTTGDRQGVAQFEVMVKNVEHLTELIHSLEKVRGVVAVERLLN